MGNQCHRHKKNDKAKSHFSKGEKDSKNIGNEPNIDSEDEQPQKESSTKINEINEGENKIVAEKNEIKKEEKKDKKEKKINLKVKEEEENIDMDVNNFDEEDCTCKIKLEISLNKLPDDETEYQIELYEYRNARKLDKKKIAETESRTGSNNKLNFQNEIIIPFYFSQVQPLEFNIINKKITNTFTISKTLGQIVGSLRQTYRTNLPNGSMFEVKAILNDELNKECSFNINVSGALTGMKIAFTITSLGNQYEPINKLLYESEILDNNSKVCFNEISIPINELSTDDNLDDNMVEIIFKDMAHSDELGKFKSSISELLEKEINYDLKGNKKANIICRRKNFYSLIDYLERDLHLATTIFIDFSEKGEANTHHLINNKSVFENLLENFISILEPYNEDQFFHIYAYGFTPKEKFKGDYDPNMYPLNRKIETPSISREDIKKFYDEFVNLISFNKEKTKFNLIVKKFNNIVKEDFDVDYIREYNVLLLFVNSDVSEEKELINELILSTNFPISIIIIGLGKGPFPNLENLEEKFLSFTDNEGNKPNRKNFKFVSFNNYSRNYQNTAKNSLIDIPDEMIEYLGIKNIEPKF